MLILFVRYCVKLIIIMLCLEVFFKWFNNLGFCGVLLILKVSKIIVFIGCNKVLWIILCEIFGYIVIILIGCGVMLWILKVFWGCLLILILLLIWMLILVLSKGGKFGEVKVLKLLAWDFILWLFFINWLLKNNVILLMG